MCSEIEYNMQADAILVHSRNIAVLEQGCFLSNSRTIVLVCLDGVGYAAVGKRAPKKGYLTIERWAIVYPGAVSFIVPNDVVLSIQKVATEMLTKRYHSEKHLWDTISSTTRYHVGTVVPRGNT